MANLKITQLLILLNLGSFLLSLACPTCPPPTPSHKPPTLPPKHPPSTPKPPPKVKPPTIPKTPKTPVTPTPETPCPPPPAPAPPQKKPQKSCPIDTLKLGACVDVLGGLVHIGIGSSSKDACCPVLEGLADLDAGICLCTAIKAKVLNLNVIVPIVLQVLVDCGKTAPSGFKCPA